MRALALLVIGLLAAPAAALSPPKAPAPKVEPVFANPSVKVVKITLAPGTTLPAHTTPVDATVAALQGSGVVVIDQKRQALAPHGTVFLPKAIPHAVINDGKGPLVLLVHHLLTTR